MVWILIIKEWKRIHAATFIYTLNVSGNRLAASVHDAYQVVLKSRPPYAREAGATLATVLWLHQESSI